MPGGFTFEPVTIHPQEITMSMSPERRRKLMEGSPFGRFILEDEAKKAQEAIRNAQTPNNGTSGKNPDGTPKSAK